MSLSNTLKLTIVALMFGLLLPIASVSADYVDPQDNPPVCNADDPGCESPIHTGVVKQAKRGSLLIGSDAPDGPWTDAINGLWSLVSSGANAGRSLMVDGIGLFTGMLGVGGGADIYGTVLEGGANNESLTTRINGNIGAEKYCDVNGQNCTTSGSIGGFWAYISGNSGSIHNTNSTGGIQVDGSAGYAAIVANANGGESGVVSQASGSAADGENRTFAVKAISSDIGSLSRGNKIGIYATNKGGISYLTTNPNGDLDRANQGGVDTAVIPAGIGNGYAGYFDGSVYVKGDNIVAGSAHKAPFYVEVSGGTSFPGQGVAVALGHNAKGGDFTNTFNGTVGSDSTRSDFDPAHPAGLPGAYHPPVSVNAVASGLSGVAVVGSATNNTAGSTNYPIGGKFIGKNGVFARGNHIGIYAANKSLAPELGWAMPKAVKDGPSYAGYFDGAVAVDGALTVKTGRGQFTGNTAPTTGAGLELGYGADESIVASFDRAAGAAKQLRFNALNYVFQNTPGATGVTNMVLTSAGNLGLGTATPSAKLHVAGNAKIDGNNTFEFGAGVAGKEGNAGKIGYQTFTAGALDVVGAGTVSGSRSVKIWDNLTVPGDIITNRICTIAGVCLNTTEIGGDSFWGLSPASGDNNTIQNTNGDNVRVEGATISRNSYVERVNPTTGSAGFYISSTGEVVQNNGSAEKYGMERDANGLHLKSNGNRVVGITPNTATVNGLFAVDVDPGTDNGDNELDVNLSGAVPVLDFEGLGTFAAVGATGQIAAGGVAQPGYMLSVTGPSNFFGSILAQEGYDGSTNGDTMILNAKGGSLPNLEFQIDNADKASITYDNTGSPEKGLKLGAGSGALVIQPNGIVSIEGSVRITGGNPQSGNVLTAVDDDGNAAWRPATGGGVTTIAIPAATDTTIPCTSGADSVCLVENTVNRPAGLDPRIKMYRVSDGSDNNPYNMFCPTGYVVVGFRYDGKDDDHIEDMYCSPLVAN